jgi:hypothetical protein
MKRNIITFIFFAVPVLIACEFLLKDFYFQIPYFAQFSIKVIIIVTMSTIGDLVLNKYFKE